MKLHPGSHTDHLRPAVLEHLLRLFKDRTGSFVETAWLPDDVPYVACDLHGPATGGRPVPEAEVVYAARPGRAYPSRLTARPGFPTRQVTVVAGPHAGEPCVLYTAYGGPPAPRELGDPALSAADRPAAEAFWKDHALSAPGGRVKPPPEVVDLEAVERVTIEF